MFEEINARLVEIQGELRKKDKYKKQLADYTEELRTIEEVLSQLHDQFESEREDVEKLEGMTLTNLFAKLSGRWAEKLSKEKQEMLAAQHRLEEATKTKKEIDDEMLRIRNQLQLLKNAEDEFQDILIKKENIIKTSSLPLAAKVFECSEQEGTLLAYLKELDEAIVAGNRVKGALIDAIGSLEKAENWGTWDMFGGGTISGIVKHQHIDQGEAYLHQAQRSMRQFQKELLDVKEQAQLEVNISGMLKFADFFFDGFIADFMVQGKIQNSLSQTRDQHRKVNDILRKLEEQVGVKRTELDAIQREKMEIVKNL
ncbi:hypothetical protein [Fredinandcohnia quinoae]|uniref:Uncharacterized protein n=1 Tax=Fredinandcohnia quinoae TaxID=2918902 RepID=A0AAW5EB29_9BACI|nr:hypothetical protein [Fredinandcohnia sp. SECRCQ15]MCH1625974.1 hypothetical protein [Fredinandcohnia sp. SECRCQ15]